MESDICYDLHEHTWPRLRDNNLDKHIEMDAGIDDSFVMVFLGIQRTFNFHASHFRNFYLIILTIAQTV